VILQLLVVNFYYADLPKFSTADIDFITEILRTC